MGKKQRLKQIRREEKQKIQTRTMKWQSNAVIIGIIVAVVALLAVYGYFAYQKKAQGKNGRVVIITTTKGDIKIEFFEKDCPVTTANFISLARKKFYSGIKFHRVEKGFVVQTGDPNSKDTDPSNDGQGGPGYTIPLEIGLDKNNQPKHKNVEGAVGMAKTPGDMNSNGSQFYILLSDKPELDGGYTIFGKVIEGMDVVRKIKKGDTIKKIAIEGQVTLD